jgi:hypothetical protein
MFAEYQSDTPASPAQRAADATTRADQAALPASVADSASAGAETPGDITA